MKYYELTYLISSELKEEEIKKIVEEINSFLQKEGGIIQQSISPLLKILSYPIKKQKEAYFVTLDFNFAQTEKLKDLEKELKDRSGILRFSIIAKKTEDKLTERVVAERKIKPRPIPENTEEKVELKDIDKKLEEILGE